MSKNDQNLSPDVHAYVQQAQLFLQTELGQIVTPTEVVDAFVRCHAHLTAVLGVDAGLFYCALASLVEQGDGQIVTKWVKTIGTASGCWTPGAPMPKMVPVTCAASALHADAVEPQTRKRKSSKT
jgi:hypothetical protein